MRTRVDAGHDNRPAPATGSRWRRGGRRLLPGPPRPRGRERPAARAGARRALGGWRAEALAYLLLAVAVALPVLLTDRGRLPVDTSAHLYLDPARALGNSLEMWDPAPYLGQANYNTGIAPLAAAFWLVQWLIGPLELAMRLWRVALLLVAAAGAARLFDQLGGAAARRAAGRGHWSDRAGRVAAAAVYVCNPYMLVSGATSPILVPAAVLPWLLLALHHTVRDLLPPGAAAGLAPTGQARSWRWPAAFGVAVFCMTGVNAGVVPAFMLLAVPCYLVWARVAFRVRWGVLLRATGRCALAALPVSAYWLTPAVLAAGVGGNVAHFTESVEVVARTSSFAETLRGLGFWTMYGRTGSEPWQPGFTGYLTNPLMVLGSYALPVAAAVGALLSRSRLRLLGVLLLGLGVPLMVGLYPPRSPSPLGRAFGWVFDHVPGGIALRTTNKAGALAMLGLALLIALGTTAAARRLRGAWRALAAAAVAVLAVAVLPAWTGGLFPTTVKVPGYWREAAAALNASTPDSRVLLLPDQQNALYRWGNLSIEDVSQSLLRRNAAVRSSVIVGASLEQANFLAATSAPVGRGWAQGGLATMARYLGAADVLVRNDMRWEESSDRHPAEVDTKVAQEPGLRRAGTFGRRGEQTLRPSAVLARDGDGADDFDALLPPLVRYVVEDPRAILRTEPAGGTVLVDGDNFALPTMARLGLLDGEPPFRLLGSLDQAAFERALRDREVGRIVLSDSNRRRAWTTGRLVDGYTPTLAADDPIWAGEPSLSLFGPDEQSVAVLHGARRISVSRVGSLLGFHPNQRALFAFDGDPGTAWTIGDFGSAVGQSVTIELDRERELGSVTLRPAPTAPQRVAAALVRAGDREVAVTLPDDADTKPVEVPLGGVRADRVTVTITAVRGTAGINPVGFTEITIPGVEVAETVRLPLGLRRLTARLGAADRELLAGVPVEVVLKRQGLPRGSFRDEERVVDRTFWLPDDRVLTLTGTVSPGPDLPDETVDALARQAWTSAGRGIAAVSGAREPPTGGDGEQYLATSSSRWLGQVENRASRALDGDRKTAWSPATRDPGEWIDVSFPRQHIDHVVVAQPALRAGGAYATRAQLSIDGGTPLPVTLAPGMTRVDFPARTARRVRLTLTGVSEFGDQVRITELGVGTVRAVRSSPQRRLRGCVTIGTLDGEPLRATMRGFVTDLDELESFDLQPCGVTPDAGRLRLGAVEHRLRAAKGWLLDELRLASTPGPAGGPAQAEAGAETRRPAAPGGRLLRTTRTTATLTTRQARAPYYLVLGQGFDRGWSAVMDGKPLGPPILVDGYSAGWRIADLGPHRFEITYAPQRSAAIAQAVSLVALVVLLTVWLRPRRRRDVPDSPPTRAPTAPPARSRLAARLRRLAASAAACAVLWLAGGLPGLALGMTVAVWDMVRPPSARHLLIAAAGILALVPVVVLASGLPDARAISPLLVEDARATHMLAGAGLALLVLGAVRDVRGAAARR